MDEQEGSKTDTDTSYMSSLALKVIALAKEWMPNVVPLITFFAALPYLVLCSLIAGWLVWAGVPKGWSSPIYLHYGEQTVPYADLEVTGLVPAQTYEISVQLSVLANEASLGLGNFMTSLTLYSQSNETIASYQRPSLVLPPRNSLISFVRDTRLQTLSIPLSASFIPGSSSILAHVEIGRKDGWKNIESGVVHELNVYEASLRGIVKPAGLQRLLVKYPMTISALAAILFFIVSSSILLSCLLPSVFEGREQDATEVKNIDFEEKVKVEEGARTMTAMRRVASRHQEDEDTEGQDSRPGPIVRRRSGRGVIKEEEE